MNPNWGDLSLPAAATTVSAQGSVGWAVTANGDIYRYLGSTWTLQTNLPTVSPFVGISSSTDGSVACVAANASSYTFAYGSWAVIPTPVTGTASVAIGDLDNVMLVDNNGAKHQVLNGILYPHSGTIGPTRLSATVGLTEVWGVSSSGTVYRWNGSYWATISGKFLRQIDVSLSPTNVLQVVGVDAAGNGWIYNTTTLLWGSIGKPNSPSDKFVWIEATRGFILCFEYWPSVSC